MNLIGGYNISNGCISDLYRILRCKKIVKYPGLIISWTNFFNPQMRAFRHSAYVLLIKRVSETDITEKNERHNMKGGCIEIAINPK